MFTSKNIANNWNANMAKGYEFAYEGNIFNVKEDPIPRHY
jgi:hypothetical protein